MAVSCPFCRADRAELISLFGSQLLLSQYRCATCGGYFEGVRQDPGSGSWDQGGVPQIPDPRSLMETHDGHKPEH
jgi:hypothetical protein